MFRRCIHCDRLDVIAALPTDRVVICRFCDEGHKVQLRKKGLSGEPYGMKFTYTMKKNLFRLMAHGALKHEVHKREIDLIQGETEIFHYLRYWGFAHAEHETDRRGKNGCLVRRQGWWTVTPLGLAAVQNKVKFPLGLQRLADYDVFELATSTSFVTMDFIVPTMNDNSFIRESSAITTRPARSRDDDYDESEWDDDDG